MCAITALPALPSGPTTNTLVNAKNATSQETTPTPRRRLRVSFDESQNRVYRNMQWSADRARKQWHSAQEFQTMKDDNTNTAKRIYKKATHRHTYDQQYKHLVLNIYDACCTAVHVEPENDSSCHQDADDEAIIVAPEAQNILRQALRTASFRIGLERTFIREISADRKYRRAEVVQRVLQAQVYDQGHTTDKTALMRLASRSISRTSRLYAHQMAVGLAESLVV